ncbi:hypothetical protein CCYA_CCYA04G1342 [Cyanidiococcus yangmingshanensis]|nr:hypothetical protein CCYA_CCYA04G1342 [Cyanidiococcus yangmingshanensis]
MLTNYFTNVKSKRVQAVCQRKHTDSDPGHTKNCGTPAGEASRKQAVSGVGSPSPVFGSEGFVLASSDQVEESALPKSDQATRCVPSTVLEFLDSKLEDEAGREASRMPHRRDSALWTSADEAVWSISEEDWAPLVEIMDGIESARLLLRARRMRSTFEHIRAVVQQKSRRELTRKRLGQLLALVPECFYLEHFGPGADDFCIDLRDDALVEGSVSAPSSGSSVGFGDAYAIMQRRSLLRERLQHPERRPAVKSGQQTEPMSCSCAGISDATMVLNTSSTCPPSPQTRCARKRSLPDNGDDHCEHAMNSEPLVKKTRLNICPAIDATGAERGMCSEPRHDNTSVPTNDGVNTFVSHPVSWTNPTRAHADPQACASPMSRITSEESPSKSSWALSSVQPGHARVHARKPTASSIADSGCSGSFDDFLPTELIERIRERASERDYLESCRPFDEACLNFRRLVHTADLVYSFFQSTSALGRPRRCAELDHLVAFVCQHHESAPLSHSEAVLQLQRLAAHSQNWCSIERGRTSGRVLFRISPDRESFRCTRQHLESLLVQARKQAALNNNPYELVSNSLSLHKRAPVTRTP